MLEIHIGFIHFRGGWRQYVFQAFPSVDMSRSCHKEIDTFIDKLMVDWKKSLSQSPKSDLPSSTLAKPSR
jgi:hypothetical protein